MKSKFMMAAAVCLCLCFAGCGGAEEAGQTETVTESVTETLSETVSETEEAVTETEAEAEVSDDEDTSGDETPSGDLFQGSGYTLKIDGSSWTDIAEFMESSVNLNTAEGFDGMFVRADDSGANMTFITLNAQMPADINAEDYLNEVEQQYSETEGLVLVSCEDCTVGDNKCIKTLTENTAAGARLKAVQYMFPRDDTVVVMTFTAGEEEWDELLPEFERVVESVKFE